jgi:hypothetical protein
MAAPEFVPAKPTAVVRTYASPPRRSESWKADRPGDLGGEGQPRADRYGNQGPDQGYVLTLVRQFDGQIHAGATERDDDVTAGVVAVALKRASLFGRAPVVHDLRVAYTIFGFLDITAPSELVELRTKLFAGVGHAHHYTELRALADSVPEGTLRLSPAEVAAQYDEGWRELLSV